MRAKHPGADAYCRTCGGSGEAQAESPVGCVVATAICDCVIGIPRLIALRKLLRKQAQERANT